MRTFPETVHTVNLCAHAYTYTDHCCLVYTKMTQLASFWSSESDNSQSLYEAWQNNTSQKPTKIKAAQHQTELIGIWNFILMFTHKVSRVEDDKNACKFKKD